MVMQSTKRATTVACEIHGVPAGTYCFTGSPYVCVDRRNRFFIDTGEPKTLAQRRKEAKLAVKTTGK